MPANLETKKLLTAAVWAWDAKQKAKPPVAPIDQKWRIKGRDARSVRDELQSLLAKSGAHVGDLVRLFDAERWGFRCRCSSERVREMLRALGKDEIDEVVAEQGAVTVTCDFCNANYSFDAVDAERLFAGDGPEAPAWEM